MNRNYPRHFRLRKSSEFRLVQRNRKRIHSPSLVVCYRFVESHDPRFGLTVSRKVGNAVIRNRVKRRLREVIRHERSSVHGVELVFIAKPSAANADLNTLRSEVIRAIRRVMAGK